MDNYIVDIETALQNAINFQKKCNYRDAENIYRCILDIKPNNPNANYNIGVLYLQIGKINEGLFFLKKSVNILPKNNIFLASYINALLKNNNYSEALSIFNISKKYITDKKIIKKFSKNKYACNNDESGYRKKMGDNIIMLFENKDYFEAKIQSKKFIKQFPNESFGYKALGTILIQLMDNKKAINILKRAVCINNNDAEIYNSLGNAFKNLNMIDSSIVQYKKALRINPNFSGVYNNLGNSFKKIKDMRSAILYYKKALEIDPNSSEAYNNIGIAFQESGDVTKSLVSYRKALEIDPNSSEAHNNIGNVLKDLGKFTDALSSYKRALEIDPNFSEVYLNMGNLFRELGFIDRSIACYKRTLQMNPKNVDANSNLLFSYNLTKRSQHELFNEYNIFSKKFENSMTFFRHSMKNNIRKKMKIGYVSGDFWNHPVSYFIKGVIANHDKEKFDIFAYSTAIKSDNFTKYIKENVTKWRSIVGLSDNAAAKVISDDEIDILVDLSGHTNGNRLLVFARKPAPIQITWLGFLNTTGLKSIDYIFCNKWMVTKEDERFCSETPWYFDGTSSCFLNEALEKNIPILESPVLKNKFMTFGCFNQYCKINEEVIRCWIDILTNIPNSRLFCKNKVFINDNMKYSFKKIFETNSIDESRILLEATSPVNEFLNSFNNVDISLDTFPYNGGTITCHSLSMGVPVITIKGNSVISHVGESFLRPMELDDWIAQDKSDYVEKAIYWSKNIYKLANIRHLLRDKFKKIYGNTVNFTLKLEDAYHEMWKIWCDKNL